MKANAHGGYYLENSYNKILNTLRNVRTRVLLKITIRNSVIGVCAALAIGIIMGLLSRIIPIYNVYALCGYIAVAIVLLALLSVFIFIPKKKAIAHMVDSFGLQERITTSLELENENSVYKELLVNDTVSKLEKLKYKENIGLLPHKNVIIVLIVLIFAFGVTLILPEPMKEEAQQLHDLNVYKKEQKNKVDKSEKEVKENSALTEEQKKALLAKLEALKQELKNVKDTKEVDKALEKTAKKLELEINKSKDVDLKNMAEKLAQNKETKDLAAALKSEKVEDIEKQLEELKNKAKSLDSEGKESLKDALAKASNAMSDGELKDSIDGLNNALSSGDENAINKSVEKVNGAVSNSLSQQAMNDALAQAQSNLQGQQPNATAQGQSQGQGQGQGAGQGSGQGQGQGQGAGGSGAGSGSGNGDGGVTPYGQGGIANKAPSSGTEKEYEKIFTPSRLGGQGETSAVTGKSNENSGKSETTITSNSNATLGELKPYNQVIGEYSEKAIESINSSSIPSGMEDIIKGYFSSLQE